MSRPMRRLVICTGLGFALAVAALVGGCATTAAQPKSAAGSQGRSPNTSDAFRFVILADRTGGHVPGAFEQAITEVNLLKPDFVMCVGDLIEGDSTDERVLTRQWQEMEDMISRLHAPFYYVPGNHDVNPGRRTDPDTPRAVYESRHSVLGKTYYSFEYRDCHFLVLNTPTAENDPSFAAEQKAFIEKDLTTIRSTQHVFVFTHYPLADNKTVWPTLKRMLPRNRSTVFTGHWHSLNYQDLDGIPAYVLPSTAAESDGGVGTEHMYAYVNVDRGTPTISLIPLGQIKPAATYAQAVTAMREVMRGTPVPGANAEGCQIALRPRNLSQQPITVDYRFLAADWEITPANAQVAIPTGQAAEVKFTLKPLSATPTNPTFVQQYSLGGFAASQQSKLPVSYVATLGQISQLKVDAQPNEWAAVPALEITTPTSLFQGRDLWRGPMDSSARVRTAIAGDRLAMLIEVADDQINTDQKEPWANDAVEICWDTRPAGSPDMGMVAGTGQMGIVPADSAGPAKQLAFVPAGQFGKPAPTSIQSFTRRTSDGYTIEFSVPLSELGASAAGTNLINLAICLDDRDIQGSDAVTKRFSITGTGEFWKSTAGYARFITKP